MRSTPKRVRSCQRFMATLMLSCCTGVAPPAWAQDKANPLGLPELRLSTAQSPAFPMGRAAARWAALINASPARKHEVKLYPGSILAGRDPTREWGALRDGATDLAVGSALTWSAQFPSAGVYALPWLAAEPAEREALAGSTALLELVGARAAEVDVIVLAVAPTGDRVLATSKSAVLSPAEAAGLRLRVTNVPLSMDTFAALSVQAQTMDFAAAQTALTAGTLDGQEAMPTVLAAQRITASGQRTVTRWGAFSDVMLFAVRRSVWEAWSEAQRGEVRAAALLAAREAGAPASEDTALAELVKQGVTLVTLSPGQRAVFRAAVRNVWVKWTPAIGPELVAAAQSAVAAVVKAEPPGARTSTPAPGTSPVDVATPVARPGS